MKVHVVGGGPAGLYFAILMKKAWPQTRITVFERNKPDDTFGFGVVFSDQTLEAFEAYDRETYRQIVGHFAYWDDIEIHFRGTVAPHRRQRLLRLLARDAAEDSRPARALARHRAQVPVRRRSDQADDPRRRPGGRRRRHQFAHPRGVQGHTSSRPSSCGPTTSPGWARPSRSTPSTSSSARPSTASSSRTATSTSPAARPGSSRPIPRRSSAPASTRSTRPAPPPRWRRCSPRSSAATS